MTLDEAKIIAEIIRRADNGCSNCVSQLVIEASTRLPQFKWSMGKEESVTIPVDWDKEGYTCWLPKVTVEERA